MSKPSITLVLRDGLGVRKAAPPHEGADHAIAQGACPYCRASPFKVAGSRASRHHDHDTHYADAGCLACKAHVGELRVKVCTIFGIEEDRAVLQGRCRVY